ncbi:MAG: hypothetical protein WKF75_10545 [Singulisphaera sp.]
MALTKLEASRSFSHYFRALFESSVDPVAGAVLIHPKRDLDLGGGRGPISRWPRRRASSGCCRSKTTR